MGGLAAQAPPSTAEPAAIPSGCCHIPQEQPAGIVADLLRRAPRGAWAQDPRRFQYDYIIESGVRIGAEEEAYLEFEGTVFRWINGTAERNAIISMPVEKMGDHSTEVARLNRLLSALSWHQKVPVTKQWGAVGPRRGFPVVYGPRMSGGVQVDVQYVQSDLARQRTPEQWFALALFREGSNSRSNFYSFLCFYKVLGFAMKDRKQRSDWINNMAPKLSFQKERIAKILTANADLETYLRDAVRNAIEHVWHKPILDPDNPADEEKINNDVHVIEDLARLAIVNVLGLS
ncbi:MAG: methylamine utilization protein MauJ [Terriglobales bacterium]